MHHRNYDFLQSSTAMHEVIVGTLHLEAVGAYGHCHVKVAFYARYVAQREFCHISNFIARCCEVVACFLFCGSISDSRFVVFGKGHIIVDKAVVGSDDDILCSNIVVNAFHAICNLFHAVAASIDNASIAVVSGIVNRIMEDINQRSGEYATQFFLVTALYFFKIHAHSIRHIFAQMLGAFFGSVENCVVETESNIKEVHLLIGQKRRLAVFCFGR